MPENWYEDEEAVLRLSAIAASLKGEALSEEEEALAPLILAELKSWCHIDAVPEGALWPAAEELLRRVSGLSGGGGNVSRVTLGDYTVSYAGSAAGGCNWAQSLTAWRKMKF